MSKLSMFFIIDTDADEGADEAESLTENEDFSGHVINSRHIKQAQKTEHGEIGKKQHTSNRLKQSLKILFYTCLMHAR